MLRILTILFLFSVFFTSVSQIFAQEHDPDLIGVDLTTSPLFFEFSTEKGAAIKDKIRVRNNSADSIPLRLSLQRLAPGANSEAALSDPKPEDEFPLWVKVDSATITARPREWTDIPFTIHIPETAAFGYYFAFLLTQTAPQKEPGTAKVAGGVAIPVLLNVKVPGAIVKGELLKFKSKAFINEYLPVEFAVQVANSGNVHIKPRGNIFIRGSKGKDLAILEINQALGSVLPQTKRSFENSWTDGFLVKEKGKLKINWNKLTDFRIGG